MDAAWAACGLLGLFAAAVLGTAFVECGIATAAARHAATEGGRPDPRPATTVAGVAQTRA
jgi:hypothetical protein